LGVFERAHQLAMTLAAASANSLARRNLAISCNGMGDASLALGRMAAARDYYSQSLEIAEPLATANRDLLQVQLDLAATYQKLGSVSLDLDAAVAARDYYGKGLAVAEALAAANPGNPQVQRTLAVFYGSVGHAHSELGELATACDYYCKGLAAAQALAAADPSNVDSQRDLSLFYAHLGRVNLGAGEAETARDYYLKALKIAEALAAADPNNADAQRTLAVTYTSLGKASLEVGEAEVAREHYHKGLKLAEARAAADRGDVRTQECLATVCHRLGDLERKGFEYQKALGWYERSLAIRRRPAEEVKIQGDPQDSRLIHELEREMAFCRLAARAITDLDFALAQPAEVASALLIARAQMLARYGQHLEAATTTEKLLDLAPEGIGNWYSAACCYARCIPGVASGKSPDQFTAEEKALRERYAARAVELLREAIRNGYKDGKHLKKNADLTPLRQREDFKELIQEFG
jgi:tetratricopeptide (TPR) repeat protein